MLSSFPLLSFSYRRLGTALRRHRRFHAVIAGLLWLIMAAGILSGLPVFYRAEARLAPVPQEAVMGLQETALALPALARLTLPATELDGFLHALSLRYLRAEHMLLIHYEAQDPHFAAAAANAVLDSLAPGSAQAVRAVAPEKPHRPDRWLLILGAGPLCWLLAAALVCLREDRLTGFRTPAQLRQAFDLRVAGLLPEVPALARGESAASRLLAFPRDPDYSEAIRILRAALLEQEGSPQVILITSSLAAEGKTSTAYALAAAVRLIGKRCLLVDGDMRRAELTEILPRTSPIPLPGLSDYLAEAASLEEIIHAHERSGFALVLSGQQRATQHPLDLFASPRLAAFWEEARKGFDVILLDAPPVLEVADSLRLAAFADAVLYLTRWERTTRESVAEGLHRLRQAYPALPVHLLLTRADRVLQPLYATER